MAYKFFTWDALMTCTGATLATTLFTQFFKNLPVIKKLPTRIFSYIVAVTVMLLSAAFTDGLTLSNAAISLVNGVIVALASNGAYDAVSAQK